MVHPVDGVLLRFGLGVSKTEDHFDATLSRQSLQRHGDLRVRETKVLLDNAHYSGAYYRLGYAAECSLDTCLTNWIPIFYFPDHGGERQECGVQDYSRRTNPSPGWIHLPPTILYYRCRPRRSNVGTVPPGIVLPRPSGPSVTTSIVNGQCVTDAAVYKLY